VPSYAATAVPTNTGLTAAVNEKGRAVFTHTFQKAGRLFFSVCACTFSIFIRLFLFFSCDDDAFNLFGCERFEINASTFYSEHQDFFLNLKVCFIVYEVMKNLGDVVCSLCCSFSTFSYTYGDKCWRSR